MKIIDDGVEMSISPSGVEIEESVHPSDRAAKKAEELLPCLCQNVREPRHHPDNTYCPAYNRPAVAAELSKAYAEIEQWEDRCRAGYDLCNQKDAEIARLRAELAKVKP